MGHRRPAWQLSWSSSSVLRLDSSFETNMLFLVKLNLEFSSQQLEVAQAT